MTDLPPVTDAEAAEWGRIMADDPERREIALRLLAERERQAVEIREKERFLEKAVAYEHELRADYVAQLEEQAAEIGRLREALRHYGNHVPPCPLWITKGEHPDNVCTCRFEKEIV